MKHAGQTALDALEPWLARLRAVAGLKEKSRGVFYFRSRAALHFHEDPAGLFADVRAPGEADFVRRAVCRTAERDALVTDIENAFWRQGPRPYRRAKDGVAQARGPSRGRRRSAPVD